MNGISEILFQLFLRSTMNNLNLVALPSATLSRLMKTVSLSSEEWRDQCYRHFMKGLLLIERVRLWRGTPLRLHSLRFIQRTTFTQRKETTKHSMKWTYGKAQVSNDYIEDNCTSGVSQNLPNWCKPSRMSCNSALL